MIEKTNHQADNDGKIMASVTLQFVNLLCQETLVVEFPLQLKL